MNPSRRFAALALVAASFVATLAGCAGAPTVADYATQTPAFDLKTYFDGDLVAHGVFTDRAGKVQRRFVVQLKGSWVGNDGTLDEAFTYSDGKTERRVWHIQKLPDADGHGRYTGTADDVLGTATGESAGNALRWNYTLKLPVDGKVYEVQFDDWMVLIDRQVMINKAAMSKFGVHLGDVTLSFRKP